MPRMDPGPSDGAGNMTGEDLRERLNGKKRAGTANARKITGAAKSQALGERNVAMEQNSVGENVKRAMAKAVLDEALRMLDSGECKDMSPEELVARLDKFKAEPPVEKVKKTAADDTAGRALKAQFWSFGSVSCGDGTICLREVSGSDREGYLRLQREYSALRSLLEDEDFCAKLWNDHCGDTALTLSAMKHGEYIGYCGIKDTSKEPWEIAVELLPGWTHQGVGTTAVSAMLDALKERLGVTAFRVRIDPYNVASQGLFEKLGARPNGISRFILQDEEEIRQCEETNLHLINDALRAVARKFDVEPRRLLSHVLEYTLCWD